MARFPKGFSIEVFGSDGLSACCDEVRSMEAVRPCDQVLYYHGYVLLGTRLTRGLCELNFSICL